jgi:zinc protease
MIRKFPMILLIACSLFSACLNKKQDNSQNMTLSLPENESPFIAFNIWVRCGSQNDPGGKEGLASLTAAMLSEGSTKKHSYEQIMDLLYPMASGYEGNVDKEMTSFTGRIHKDQLEAYYSIFKEALIEPAFKEEDFKRIKMQTLNYLQQTRRFSNDEELAKELLFSEIFRTTPYGHPEEGYVNSVNSITLADVKDFYNKFYTSNNVVIALGGGYPSGFEKRVRGDFNALSKGLAAAVPKPQPASINGIQILLVEKDTNTSPVSFGFPISLLRSDKDFPAMMLFNSSMGEHRNSFGRLYQVIRETRGINYGDYTYIEAFPRGYSTQVPPVNVSRRSQIFEGWLRPIAATGSGDHHDRILFTIRAALRELNSTIQNGMDEKTFDAARLFLTNYVVNYGATLNRRLAYRVDDAFYGIPDPGFLVSIKPKLEALTRDQVNAAIKKHLQLENMSIVVITKDAEDLKKKLLSGASTNIKYAGPQPAAVLEEDKEISVYPIPVKEQDIRIVNINEVFE